ncbi:MAG: hypothetical protein ABJD11_13530 [Gemmatimonadota bacterium]
MPLSASVRTIAALFCSTVLSASGAVAQSPAIPLSDRIRLAELFRISEPVRGKVWPAWRETQVPVLLVTDSAEFLMHHPHPSAEFVSLGFDSVLHTVVWTRPRVFSPKLLATFPAVGGIPTVVVGNAEATGQSSAAWVVTLLHEEFHQFEYSQPDYYPGVEHLQLAHGDTSGMWMLNYPFPYDSAPVQGAMRSLGTALVRALDADRGHEAAALVEYRAARTALSRELSAEQERYLEFQLWQEGTARAIEYDCARRAARMGKPSAEFRALPDYLPYDSVAANIRSRVHNELQHVDLAERRRVSFYALGAGTAWLAERVVPDWQRRFLAQPYRLDQLFASLR